MSTPEEILRRRRDEARQAEEREGAASYAAYVARLAELNESIRRAVTPALAALNSASWPMGELMVEKGPPKFFGLGDGDLEELACRLVATVKYPNKDGEATRRWYLTSNGQIAVGVSGYGLRRVQRLNSLDNVMDMEAVLRGLDRIATDPETSST